MLDASTLAAQLRQPHGDAALAVADSMNRSNSALNLAAIGLLSVAAGEHILEIGPGNAAFAPQLMQAPGSQYLGVELSAAMVEAGNQRLASAGLGDRAAMRLGDAHALPVDEASVDAALAVNTLYFWPNLARCWTNWRAYCAGEAGYAWRSAIRPSCAACRSPPISSCMSWTQWSWPCAYRDSTSRPGATIAKPPPAMTGRRGRSISICCWRIGADCRRAWPALPDPNRR